MFRPTFSSGQEARLIGFVGEASENEMLCQRPLYRFGSDFAIGGTCEDPMVLVGRQFGWIEGLVAKRSLTRLPSQEIMTIREDQKVIVVGDKAAARFDEVISGWRDKLTYQPIKRPRDLEEELDGEPSVTQEASPIWAAIECREAELYIGSIAHRLGREMDVRLRNADGKGRLEAEAEALGWIIWPALSIRDEHHRRMIMVRLVAARRMRMDQPPEYLEALRTSAAKSLFLSVPDKDKRNGFNAMEQLDRLVDGYVERLIA